MFKDFTRVNAAEQQLTDKTDLSVLQDFASLIQRKATAGVGAASEYSRLYAQVQQTKYDSEGNITDVTSDSRASVPDSVISRKLSDIASVEDAIEYYRKNFPQSINVSADSAVVYGDDKIIIRAKSDVSSSDITFGDDDASVIAYLKTKSPMFQVFNAKEELIQTTYYLLFPSKQYGYYYMVRSYTTPTGGQAILQKSIYHVEPKHNSEKMFIVSTDAGSTTINIGSALIGNSITKGYGFISFLLAASLHPGASVTQDFYVCMPNASGLFGSSSEHIRVATPDLCALFPTDAPNSKISVSNLADVLVAMGPDNSALRSALADLV